MKKLALKGGSKGKKYWVQRGVIKYAFKFSSDGVCNNANCLPECQKPAFLAFRKFRFFRESMPPDPLLYYASKGNSTSLKCKKT